MMYFVLFILSTVGLSSILIESYIFQPFRDWLKNEKMIHKYKIVKYLKAKLSKIFSCFQCMGFWAGLINGFVLISFNPLIALCCGFAGSFISSFSASFMNYLEAQTLLHLGNDKDE